MKEIFNHKSIICMIIFGFTLFWQPLWGTTIRVPSQYPTIQQGLNAAQNGDTVLVASGTYFENLIWPGTDGIVLISEDGPQTTIIDGSGAGRVITFPYTSFTASTEIRDFTIQHGSAVQGAGILLYGSPSIIGNVISRNIAQGESTWVYGGGIHCGSSGSPLILANHLTGNKTVGELWNHGAGIYLDYQNSAVIIGNVIEYDSAIGGSWNYGVGIYCDGRGRPDIRHNVIRANAALQGHRGYGAGIYADYNGAPYILSNLIEGNIANCTIWNYGAGIYVNDSSYVINNTIVNNACTGGSSRYGGGLYIGDTNNVIGNNIITGNTASYGGGIAAYDSNYAALLNNDVWNNSPQNYYNIAPGAQDISMDPLFATGPLGDYYLSQTAAGQPQNSPCVDYGFASAESLELSSFTTRTDSIGDAGVVDLGYHYPISAFVEVKEVIRHILASCRELATLQVSRTVVSMSFEIMLELGSRCNVAVNVYDNCGRLRSVICDGEYAAGATTFTVDARGYAAGVYIVVASIDRGTMLSKKIVLVR